MTEKIYFDNRRKVENEPPHDWLVTAGCWLLDKRRLPYRQTHFYGELRQGDRWRSGLYQGGKPGSMWISEGETPRMYVIAPELHTFGLISDVIGFHLMGFSVCLECKVSRSDFLRDRRKFGDHPGNVFYYLTMPGVVNMEKDRAYLCHAGVIEYADKKFTVKRMATYRRADSGQEVMVLMRLLDYNNILGIRDYRKAGGNPRFREQRDAWAAELNKHKGA